MALDATIGGASADSYGSLAEADAYFATRTPSTAWDGLADDAAKEVVLKTATRRIEQERHRFKGYPVKPLTGTSTEPTQALWFPAYEVVNSAGWTYLSTVIPEGIKRAQFEAAYAIADGKLTLADTGLEGFDSVKVGPIAVTVRHARKAAELPETVMRHLREFVVGSGISVPLVRG